MRISRSALLALPLASLALLGCGGGGGGDGGGTPPPGGTDFVVFFTGVLQTTNVGTDPFPLDGITFTNQFPPEGTFDPLLP
jgi:hypothetical protein